MDVKMSTKELLAAVARHQRDTICMVGIGGKGQGRLQRMECAPCPPVADPAGASDEDRGTTRYLGVWISMTGQSAEFRRKATKAMAAFFRRLRECRPPLRHLRSTFQSLLASKLVYARKILAGDEMDVEDDKIAGAVLNALGLHGGSGSTARRTRELILSNVEPSLGIGIPSAREWGVFEDVRALLGTLNDTDERLAACTTAALYHGLDDNGCAAYTTSNEYPTMLGRLRAPGRDFV